MYLPRTDGISSTMLRAEMSKDVKLGIIGCGPVARRFPSEADCVSGVKVVATFDTQIDNASILASQIDGARICKSSHELYELVDAVYIATPHLSHYLYIKEAISAGKHVLCETPMVLIEEDAKELFALAEKNRVVLLEANKTAYCPAFNHLIVMIKSGVIGEVVDIEASLSKLWDDQKYLREFDSEQAGGSLYELGSYPLLPIIKLLGCQYENLELYSRLKGGVDLYTKGIIRYPRAIGSFKVGLGVKTEGNLVISGTKGYAYVPVPWWKTDYFELRYEDQNRNQRFFYKWEQSGLRYEIKEFISSIINKRFSISQLKRRESICMARVMEQFTKRINFLEI